MPLCAANIHFCKTRFDILQAPGQIQLILSERKNRQQLLCALADLTANLRKANCFAEFLERNPPCFRMQIDRVDQRSIDSNTTA